MNEQIEAVVRPLAIYGQSPDPILDSLLAEIAGFVELLRNYDIEVKTESPAARLAWENMPDEAKAKAFKGFSSYHRNCRELHNSGVSLRDNFAVLSHCLKRANLFSKESVQGTLTNEHMVEVYSLENIQIFRSINFFDYCNYSILDLLAREWMALYERLSSVTESIFREIHETVAAKEFRRLKTPAHVMKEIDAIPSGIFSTAVTYCCTLFNAPEQAAGYLLFLDVAELGIEKSGQNTVAFLR
jgi:hypothetical protein